VLIAGIRRNNKRILFSGTIDVKSAKKKVAATTNNGDVGSDAQMLNLLMKYVREKSGNHQMPNGNRKKANVLFVDALCNDGSKSNSKYSG
jgi:hypothetical protein